MPFQLLLEPTAETPAFFCSFVPLVMSSHLHIKVSRVRLPKGMKGFSWERGGDPVLDSQEQVGRGRPKRC